MIITNLRDNTCNITKYPTGPVAGTVTKNDKTRSLMKQHPPSRLSTEPSSLLLNSPAPTRRGNTAPRPTVTWTSDSNGQTGAAGFNWEPALPSPSAGSQLCALRLRVSICPKYPCVQFFGADPAPALCKQLPCKIKGRWIPAGFTCSSGCRYPPPPHGSGPRQQQRPPPTGMADRKAGLEMKNIACKLSLGLQIN